MMKAVAIFGGTFNPVHHGHLVVAEEVRTRLNLEKVIFVPTHTPPHKEPADLAEASHRHLMLTLATVSNPSFEVSTFEMDRGGKSYSIDTVRHFRSRSGEGVQLHFIVGADMLEDLSGWREVGELRRLCRFVAVPRPGHDVQKTLQRQVLAAGDLSSAEGLLEDVLVADTPLMDISATDIRRRVKEGKSIKYLVPEAVEQYILHQKLYR
jgi:nicotinate-nucleotide adenylyltransferase